MEFHLMWDGREEIPPQPYEIEQAEWIIKHERELHDAFVNYMFKEYPAIRHDVQETTDISQEEMDRVLPLIDSITELKALILPCHFTICAIEGESVPMIGIGGDCTWEMEHGFGVIMKGLEPLKYGHEDISFTWYDFEDFMK